MKPYDTSTEKQVTIQPGGLFFGEAPSVVHTLLGSCVAVTLWHPASRKGGMCHYLLARRDAFAKSDNHSPGYFGTDAIRFFLQKACLHGLLPADFEVKMFGGGNMFEGVHQRPNVVNVASSNIETGRQLLQEAGFTIQAEDVGGVRYRKIFFELSSGDVWVQYGRHCRTVDVP